MHNDMIVKKRANAQKRGFQDRAILIKQRTWKKNLYEIINLVLAKVTTQSQLKKKLLCRA